MLLFFGLQEGPSTDTHLVERVTGIFRGRISSTLPPPGRGYDQEFNAEDTEHHDRTVLKLLCEQGNIFNFADSKNRTPSPSYETLLLTATPKAGFILGCFLLWLFIATYILVMVFGIVIIVKLGRGHGLCFLMEWLALDWCASACKIANLSLLGLWLAWNASSHVKEDQERDQ